MNKNFFAVVFTAVVVASPLLPYLHANVALAHEKAFPAKQLKTLTPEGESLVFKESSASASKDKLAAAEQKYGIKFSKGELSGDLFLGQDKDKKTKVVVTFLDGKSENGDTEFGASVEPSGKIAKVAVFSSPESGDATSADFLNSLKGKNAEELDALKKTFGDKEKSKHFIVELAEKAALRIEASFGKK